MEKNGYFAHQTLSTDKGEFIDGRTYEKLDWGDIPKYFDEILLRPAARQRRQLLNQFLRANNIDPSGIQVLREDEDPKHLFEPAPNLTHVNELIGNAILPIGVPMPWHVRFCEDSDGNGDDFTLGVAAKSDPLVAIHPFMLHADWDGDLTARRGCRTGTWNDNISSVYSRVYAKPWALFWDIHFKGEWVMGFGDCRDVVDDFGLKWRDQASSVAMHSDSAALLKAAVEILIA